MGEDEILIDKRTRQILLDIDRDIVMLNDKKQVICFTILNMNNVNIEDEEWQLTQDNLKLIRGKTINA